MYKRIVYNVYNVFTEYIISDDYKRIVFIQYVYNIFT